MLGKLLKHELRASSRTMGPMLGGLLIISVLANLSFRLLDGEDMPAILQLLQVLLVIAFFVGILGAGIVTAVIMVNRFRRSFFQDEGYIMHTLPVSVHALIWSKLISAFIWFAATGLVVVLSLIAAFADLYTVRIILDAVKAIMEFFRTQVTSVQLEVLAAVAGLLILGGLELCLLVYASLSIGHSFTKNRMALSVLFFLLLNIARTLVSQLLATLRDRAFTDFMNTAAPMQAWRVIIACTAVMMVLASGVYYAITAWFMKNRLNLE